MFKDSGISEADWNSTPQSVKTVLIALEHQARLLEIRFTAYEQKLVALKAKKARKLGIRGQGANSGRTQQTEKISHRDLWNFKRTVV